MDSPHLTHTDQTPKQFGTQQRERLTLQPRGSRLGVGLKHVARRRVCSVARRICKASTSCSCSKSRASASTTNSRCIRRNKRSSNALSRVGFRHSMESTKLKKVASAPSIIHKLENDHSRSSSRTYCAQRPQHLQNDSLLFAPLVEAGVDERLIAQVVLGHENEAGARLDGRRRVA